MITDEAQMINYFAHKLTSKVRDLEFNDVQQTMYLSALKAKDKYNKESKCSFATYLYTRLTWLTQNMVRDYYSKMSAENEYSRTFTLGHYQHKAGLRCLDHHLMKKLKNKKAMLLVEFLKDPPKELRGEPFISLDAIASHFSVTKRTVNKMKKEFIETVRELIDE
jgi:hypothetical protein